MSEEFDEIIRQKFDEKEFIFNEANWEKAEKKMDASKRTKKILWWSSIFAIGLITGICLMFLWKQDKHADLANTNQVTLTETIDGNQQAGSATEAALKTDKADSDLSDLPVNTSTSEENLELSASSKKNNPGNSKIAVIPTINHSAAEEEKNSSFGAEENQPIDKAENASELMSKNKKLKRTKKSPDATQGLEKADASLLAVVTDKVKNETSKNNAATISAKKIKTVTEKSKDADKNAEKKNDLIIKSLAITDSLKSDAGAQDSILAFPTKLVATDSVSNSLTVLIATDSLEKKSDSMPALAKAADPVSSLGMDGLASINLLSIDAGINGQYGWTFLDEREARGITPVLGFGVIHYFNQKWSVSSGMHYLSIAHLKDNTFNLTTNYSFGSNVQTSVFKQQTLHYIGIPLFLQYHVNEKNAIFAGVAFSYLVNNKIKVETSHSSLVTSSISQTQGPTSDTRPGFYNKLDASIAAGYRRKLGSHFSIAPVFYFGLLDIKKDNHFNLHQFERNSGVKLILSYTIFDF